MRDPLAGLAVGDPDGADRAVERDAADHQRRRGGVDAEHVVRVGLVGTDDGDHDLGLVAEAVGEGRAQRAVGEAAGEDRILGRAAFTAEERAGDLAGRVRHAPRRRSSAGRSPFPVERPWRRWRWPAPMVRPMDANDGALALLSQLACLERQGLVGPGYRARHSNGICHCELLSVVGARRLHRSTVGAEAGSQSAMPQLDPQCEEPRQRRLTTDPMSSLARFVAVEASSGPVFRVAVIAARSTGRSECMLTRRARARWLARPEHLRRLSDANRSS